MKTAAPLSRDLRLTLAGVAELVGTAKHFWWIIGSGAIALHGAQTDVRDLDLLMSREDAARLLGSRGVEASPGPPSARFRSDIFGRLDDGALPLEIMGGFHVRGDGGWEEVRPASREAVPVDGNLFYVPSKKELIAICRLFGRDKDEAKAAGLEALNRNAKESPPGG